MQVLFPGDVLELCPRYALYIWDRCYSRLEVDFNNLRKNVGLFKSGTHCLVMIISTVGSKDDWYFILSSTGLIGWTKLWYDDIVSQLQTCDS